MTDILIAILAILFVLGVAINIHEFGHFIVAKIFGMRVEAYSFFGLGPRIFGFKIGNTDYRISAIPLGAYVKLYGDEETAPLEGGKSKDVETFLDERNIGAAEEGKGAASHVVPDSELYELRPRWQKFLVMLGGPFMNFVLAFSIPFGLALYMGVPIEPPPIVGSVVPGGAAEHAGIQVGDRIVGFDGAADPTWARVSDDALLSPEKAIPVTVERDGKRIDLNITPATMTQQGQTAGDHLFRLPQRLVCQYHDARLWQRDTAVAIQGELAGKVILSIDGQLHLVTATEQVRMWCCSIQGWRLRTCRQGQRYQASQYVL